MIHELSGDPIPSVTMTLSGSVPRTVLTNADGFYSFDGLPQNGSFTVTPSKPEYNFFPPSVTYSGLSVDEVRDFVASGPLPGPPPPSPPVAWAAFFDGSRNLSDWHPLIAIDSQDNVYVTGTAFNSSDPYGDSDIVTIKYDPAGNELWNRRFDGIANYKDFVNDIEVDSAGNVYVTGTSWRFVNTQGEGAGTEYDYTTIKYDTNGNQLWIRYYDGPVSFNDIAYSLDLDSQGNVYVAGYSTGGTIGVHVHYNFATVKYDTNGNQLWARRYDGGLGDGANEVQVDGSGNVYVTGTTTVYRGGSTSDILTFKYDTNGNQLWVTRFDTGAPLTDHDEAFELELDSQGNVYVVGSIWIRERPEAVLLKHRTSDGTLLWNRNWSRTNGLQDDFPLALAVDSNGNAFVTGQTYYGASNQNVDAFTVKFSPEGNEMWARVFNGPTATGFDGDNQMVVDEAGNCYVAVSSEGHLNYDMTTIKYLPDGTQAWAHRFDNEHHLDDLFWLYRDAGSGPSMAIDPEGNIYLAGESTLPGRQIDISVVKLSTGGTRSCSSLSPVSQFFAASGGEGDITVTAANGCNWTAAANATWITITSGESGVGNGVITYVVRDNMTGAPRTGVINIDGQTHTIVQDGPVVANCAYSISPQFNSVAASGGTGSITLTTQGQCAWQATSNVNWIRITSNQNGIGPTILTYSVLPNTNPGGRRGTISIGGHVFSVKQKGG